MSWTIKKAECKRIDAFVLWCWRRLLRVPWTARRSTQSILKEISPGCSLEGLMLKLKLQYFGHLSEELTHLKRPWCWERLRAGGEDDDRGWDGLMASLTQWTWIWVNSGSWWWTGRPGVLHSWCRKESDTTEQLNWTEKLWWSHHSFWLVKSDSYDFQWKNDLRHDFQNPISENPDFTLPNKLYLKVSGEFCNSCYHSGPALIKLKHEEMVWQTLINVLTVEQTIVRHLSWINSHLFLKDTEGKRDWIYQPCFQTWWC